MQSLYDEVVRLVAVNATHRSGSRIRDLTASRIHDSATEALDELATAPYDDIRKLADLFGLLFHYAVRKGWKLEQIELMAVRRLGEKFGQDGNAEAEA